MLNIYSTTVSQLFCCGACHSPVALVFINADDLAYVCQNSACQKTVSDDCPEALAIIADVALTVSQPAQAEALPPIEALATAAADLVLAADDAGDTRLVNALNRAAQALHDGVRITATAGGCSCEAGRSGKPCWHQSAVDVVADARARLVVLAQRARVAA